MNAEVNAELARRVWSWLPARTDSRRVTLPGTIAAALSIPQSEVTALLADLAAAGHVVRDGATGTMSGWHRGKPIPTDPDPDPQPEWSLFDPEQAGA